MRLISANCNQVYQHCFIHDLTVAYSTVRRDFTSSSVIKLEMGVSNKALEEADASYKIALTPVKFRAGVNILSKIASSFSQGDDSIIAFPETKSDQSGKKSPRGKPPGENVMEILRKNKSRGSLFVSDDGGDD